MRIHPPQQFFGGKRLGRIPRLTEMGVNVDVRTGPRCFLPLSAFIFGVNAGCRRRD
jgi:hypothetical protein